MYIFIIAEVSKTIIAPTTNLYFFDVNSYNE